RVRRVKRSAVFFYLATLGGSHLLPELLAVLLSPLAAGVYGEGGRHQLVGLDAVAGYAGPVGVERGQTVARGSVLLGGLGAQQHHGLLTTVGHSLALDVHVGQTNRGHGIAAGGGLPEPSRGGGGIACLHGL